MDKAHVGIHERNPEVCTPGRLICRNRGAICRANAWWPRLCWASSRTGVWGRGVWLGSDGRAVNVYLRCFAFVLVGRGHGGYLRRVRWWKEHKERQNGWGLGEVHRGERKAGAWLVCTDVIGFGPWCGCSQLLAPFCLPRRVASNVHRRLHNHLYFLPFSSVYSCATCCIYLWLPAVGISSFTVPDPALRNNAAWFGHMSPRTAEYSHLMALVLSTVL